MIDYEKIGQRITEQRKYIRRMSQERLAEELGMYQADISNLEKAKKGSGITDLSKLDFIADYFEISLENLLFGKGAKDMPKYSGAKMALNPVKKIKRAHRDILSKLTGNESEKISGLSFECGPYSIYVLEEHQITLGGNTAEIEGQIQQPGFVLPKLHLYVVCNDEVACVAVASVTSAMQHVYQPALLQLQQSIQSDVLDVTDVLRTLNPYWALYMFSDEKQDEYSQLMYQRMDAIRNLGSMGVLYIESIYVREDYRQLGLFRLCIDVLRKTCGDCIMWLNMEPTAGAELTDEYSYFPNYTVSELGQISLNASIAERVGFTIDPDTWRRQAEVIDASGAVHTEIVRIRKCAYYLPASVQELLKDDGDLVAMGRALQKIQQADDEDTTTVDFREGEKEGYVIVEWIERVISGPNRGRSVCCYAAYCREDPEKHKFGVSARSAIDNGINHKGQIEEYDYLDDAVNSEYFDLLCTVNSAVSRHFHTTDEND